MKPKHPAKFSAPILDRLDTIVDAELKRRDRGLSILDPFAGVGGIYALDRQYWTNVPDPLVARCWIAGVEIEQEWADAHERTICGDSTDLRAIFPAPAQFDMVVTSPCYGNRMADHHNAKDDTKRITYKHVLGHDLQPNNAGQMHFSNQYKVLHEKVWIECLHILKPNGMMVVNLKNFIKKGEVVDVVGWHLHTLLSLGFLIEEIQKIPVDGMRYGANRDLRVDHEQILVMRKRG